MLVSVTSLVVAATAVYFAASAHWQMRNMVIPVYKSRMCVVCTKPRDLTAFPATSAKRCIACIQLAGQTPKSKPKTGRQRMWQSQTRRIQCEIKKCSNGKSKPSTVADCKLLLGVNSPNELWEFLQDKLQDGMTEDNYGQWHIDHVSPVAAFDLTQEEHRQRCFHVANLQPMWAADNMSKGSKLDTMT